MNDQLSDSTLKQFFIELIRFLGVENLWWLSRAAMVWAGMADFMARAILVFAQEFWIPGLLRRFSQALYVPAIALAIALLILVLFFWGFGVQVRWVRPGALLRWTVVLFCLVSLGGPLWAWLEQTTETLPATIVTITRPPLVDGRYIGVATGGTVYHPLDQSDPQVAALNRAMAPLADQDRDGAYEAFDVALALWHAAPDEVYRGAIDFRVRTPDGALAVEGLPAGFKQTFFPTDPAVPWWSGDFTTDPNGGVKRAQTQKLAELGLLQSLTGTIAALGVLLQSLTTLLFRLGAALLFATFCALAPLGLFGKNSMWVGAIALAWLALYPLRIMVSVASLLLTVLLFGTVQSPGLGTFYPAVLGATLLYTYLHWRLFKASWGLLRTRMAPVFAGLWSHARGQTRATDSAQDDPAAQRAREEAHGFSDISIQGGASAGLRGYHALEQPFTASGPATLGQTLHAGAATWGLKSLVEADMTAAARVQRGEQVAPVRPMRNQLARPAPDLIVKPAQSPARQLDLAPRTEAGAIDARALPLLAHAAPAIQGLSERYGAPPVVAATHAATAALQDLEQDGVAYTDLALGLARGHLPPSVQAALVEAAPEIAASPQANQDFRTIAGLALGARTPLPANYVAASIGATVAAGGDLGTLEAVSGVDARTLGSGATYVGQYLQWANASGVDGTTAEQIAYETMMTGTVAPTTATHLAPDVRAEGVALAQALPAGRQWTQPLPAPLVLDSDLGAPPTGARPPTGETSPTTDAEHAAPARSLGRTALIGAGLVAAAIVTEGLLDDTGGVLDIPPAPEPVPLPDVGPAIPLMAGALAWQHRQNRQDGLENADEVEPQRAARAPALVETAETAAVFATAPAVDSRVQIAHHLPAEAPDSADLDTDEAEGPDEAANQPAPEGMSLGTKLLIGAGVVAAGVVAEGLINAEWVAEEVDPATLEPITSEEVAPPGLLPDPGTPPAPDDYIFEQQGESTIRRLNPDGSATTIQEGTPPPAPPEPPRPSVFDRFKGAMDTTITDQSNRDTSAPGR
jgi:hypothetical protein